MTIFERIKNAFIGEAKYPIMEQMPTRHRESFRSPVMTNDELQKRWNKPRTVPFKLGKVALICSMIVLDGNKIEWHGSIRLMGKKTVKSIDKWLNWERIDARAKLDEEFKDVGRINQARYFYSSHSLHISMPLTIDELAEFARYHKNSITVTEDGKGEPSFSA